MKLCAARTKAGKACPAPAKTGQKFCTMHAPGGAAACGRVGGKRRAVFDPSQLTELGLPTTAQELAHFVATTMIEVRGAKLETNIANCLGQLGSVFLRAIEQGDLEKRIEALEKAHDELRKSSQPH